MTKIDNLLRIAVVLLKDCYDYELVGVSNTALSDLRLIYATDHVVVSGSDGSTSGDIINSDEVPQDDLDELMNSEYKAYVKKVTRSEKDIQFIKSYSEIAQVWAKNSYCTRKKVGAIIVKDRMIISDGFNGTISGFPNVCELDDGSTDPSVLHAEANALTKLAGSTNSGKNSSLYVTCSPCLNCAKLIVQVGIKEVVFTELYRDVTGLDILLRAGVRLLFISI